jgi:riboflavin synthase
VALVPFTLEHTIASEYEEGRDVNLEVDLIARYLERLA